MLECANFSSDKKELIRATLTDMKTSEMREKLRRVFPEVLEQIQSSSSSALSNPALIPIKEEPVFHADDYDEVEGPHTVMYGNQLHFQNRRGNRRRGGRRRANYHNYNDGSNKKWSYNSDNFRSHRKLNPTDANGNVKTCEYCNSVLHLKDDCYDLRQSRKYGGSSQSDNKYL